jgi:CRISPR-associated endonuclease/helicase Cas3
MNDLLAKSSSNGDEKTLSGHVMDDLHAFDALFGSPDQPSPLACDWLRFFRLAPTHYDGFWRNAVAALALHDLGKANDGFQDAVRNRGPQVVRHEHLSAFLLMTPQVAEWLGSIPALDVDLVVSAVLGHHLKADKAEVGQPVSDREALYFHGDHAEVQALFVLVAKRLQAPTPAFVWPELWSYKDDGKGESIYEQTDRLTRRFDRLERTLRKDEPRRRLFRAVKAALIAADSAGSGLAREGHDIAAWVAQLFAEGNRLDGDYIEQNILKRRIQQIEQRHGDTFCYHGFQDQAATMPARTLMIAPCGTGKTLAAWRWIKAQLEQTPRGRVIFLYPTRATATEGFRDYVAHAPEADASLLTGTAAYELRDMFSNPGDTRQGGDYLTEARLYALGYWNKRLFSATVDQFLSFMQQSYKGLCLLPVLADAVVVFDEVHSFDVGLFDAFRKFLHHFDVPVLAMTASLPAGRRRALEAEGLHPFNGAGLADLTANAELERYEVATLADDRAAEAEVRAAIACQDKVLWVVNTVDRAQALAERLKDLDPICYHSRFTLDDRKKRHGEVIRAFQDREAGGRLAITTQVCEMSLDLDARLLVSEFAPISSLIQRMGRCNRHARPGDNNPGRVRLYPPEKAVPYEPDEMQMAERFVAEIDGRLVSQASENPDYPGLEELLERFTQGQGREADRWTAFIDDGPWAADRSDELRDGDDRSAQAVLDDTIYAFRAAQRAGRPTDGFIVPVPRRLATIDDRLPRYLRSAPATQYDPKLGFLKQPVSTDQGGGQ